MVKCITNDLPKYATDQCIYRAFITSRTKVPTFYEVAFKRINESRENAHMTLRHNKNWVNYYLVLKKEFASTSFVSETEISVIFPVLSPKKSMIKCDVTKLRYPFFIAMETE